MLYNTLWAIVTELKVVGNAPLLRLMWLRHGYWLKVTSFARLRVMGYKKKTATMPLSFLCCFCCFNYFVNSTMLAVAVHVLFMKKGVTIFTE